MKYENVKPKFHTIDPLNPTAMTLAQMRERPYILWLRYIEPRIVCMGSAPEDCWCWDVKDRVHNIEKWVPQLVASQNPDSRSPVKRLWNARHYVMKLFYEYPDDYSVYRNKKICSSYNCVRPSHLIVAPHNSREAKYG